MYSVNIIKPMILYFSAIDTFTHKSQANDQSVTIIKHQSTLQPQNLHKIITDQTCYVIRSYDYVYVVNMMILHDK